MKMQYRVILARGTEDLENNVNAAILDGWVPQGGVCRTVVENEIAGTQAMTRSAPKSETPNEST